MSADLDNLSAGAGAAIVCISLFWVSTEMLLHHWVQSLAQLHFSLLLLDEIARGSICFPRYFLCLIFKLFRS
jgi:hypothetical protein